jgi:preprotein translocase subunit SecE
LQILQETHSAQRNKVGGEKMKKVSALTKLLTCVASLATLVLYVLFPLFTISGAGKNDISLTGLQICFGSAQTIAGKDYTTYTSAYYILALVFLVLSAVAGVLCVVFRKKTGWRYTSVVASIASAINLGVIGFAGSFTTYLDVRPLDTLGKLDIQREMFFTVAIILAIVTAVISVIMLLVSDYVEAKESKGAKLTILQRIKNFFKDYAAELKKIVWPSKNVVIRNTIIVIAMCVVVGGFIWILDFGLSNLLWTILGIEG